MSLPKDPIMLLSYVNTQLRDHYANLDDLCNSLHLEKQFLVKSLAEIDYTYEKEYNQFR